MNEPELGHFFDPTGKPRSDLADVGCNTEEGLWQG